MLTHFQFLRGLNVPIQATVQQSLKIIQLKHAWSNSSVTTTVTQQL